MNIDQLLNYSYSNRWMSHVCNTYFYCICPHFLSCIDNICILGLIRRRLTCWPRWAVSRLRGRTRHQHSSGLHLSILLINKKLLCKKQCFGSVFALYRSGSSLKSRSGSGLFLKFTVIPAGLNYFFYNCWIGTGTGSEKNWLIGKSSAIILFQKEPIVKYRYMCK